MKLQGRVALITGAGSGLGRTSALTFARQGARVAVNDVRREAAETQARVSALSGELEKLHGKREEIRARIEKLIGQVDLLGSP